VNGQINCGIYDDFHGYRLPTEDELGSALQCALVVLDTNVLLNLYRYNRSTRNDLFGVLRGLGKRLWVPHQVMQEFWRNRLSVLVSRGASSEQALAALSKQQRGAADAVHQWAKTTAIETSERDTLIEKIETLYNELERIIRTRAPDAPSMAGSASDEPVLRELETLLEQKVGAAPDEATRQAAVHEGNARASRQQPPGYLDADKIESNLPEGAAGDYLVWHQTIQEAARRKLDVLLITGDEKEDWWWRYRSEFLGPRVELTAELRKSCGQRLFMMRPIDLLKRAATLKITVSSESVDDVERVSRETTLLPTWSAAGVAELLKCLETEGCEQADVIRVAAARGGSIIRDEIYQVCGYDDDRMLRGFTRPTARITAELQRAGIVADGVDAALTPIYRGGVRAEAFRIPAEMVTILTTEQDEGPEPAM
jgi:hypothetical protein